MKNLQPLQSILFPKPYSLVDYGYNWNLAEIMYERIVKIVRKRADKD